MKRKRKRWIEAVFEIEIHQKYLRSDPETILAQKTPHNKNCSRTKSRRMAEKYTDNNQKKKNGWDKRRFKCFHIAIAIISRKLCVIFFFLYFAERFFLLQTILQLASREKRNFRSTFQCVSAENTLRLFRLGVRFVVFVRILTHH